MVTAQQPWTDTPQQRALLRSNKAARKARSLFPHGQRVAVTGGTHQPSVSGRPGTDRVGGYGTVYRHIPGSDAQGGTVVVDLDNGVRARLNPITLRPIRDGEQ
jgi:hypothetical protein